MNSLSWLIYGAEVIGNLRGVMTFCVGAGSIFAVFSAVGWMCNTSEVNCSYNKTYRPEAIGGYERLAALCLSTFKLSVSVAAVGLLLATFIPSERVIYMVAGSQAGEMAVTSEYGQEVMEQVKAILSDKLSELGGVDGSEK